MEKTYDPILASREFENGIFARIPMAMADQVVILSEREGSEPLFYIEEGRNPEAKQVKRSLCGWQTTIDLSGHMISLDITARAKDHISNFLVHLQLAARVSDPKIIYREHITDITDYIRSDLEGIVEEIAAAIDIRDDMVLKRLLQEHMKCHQEQELEGVVVKLKKLTVDIDQESKAHLKEILQTDRNKEIHISKQTAAKEIGRGLDGDVGALMEVLDGMRSASDIEDVRRKLKKDKVNDVIEEIMQEVDFLTKLMDKGVLSEKDGQRAMKDLIPKLNTVAPKKIGAQEADIYKPFDGSDVNEEEIQ